MLRNSIKDDLKNLDSDQKAILWSFICITGLTLLSGLIFKDGLSFLFTFIPAWMMFSNFFGRKNKSVEKDGKYIAANGKEFTRKDKRLYWIFFWSTFIVGAVSSPFIAILLSSSDVLFFFMLYIPYACCTIYGFVKKIPLNTFLESSKNYHSFSTSKSLSASFTNDILYSPLYSHHLSNIYHRNDRI